MLSPEPSMVTRGVEIRDESAESLPETVQHAAPTAVRIPAVRSRDRTLLSEFDLILNFAAVFASSGIETLQLHSLRKLVDDRGFLQKLVVLRFH